MRTSILLAAALLALGSPGCAKQESKSQSRERLLDEIIEAQGLNQLAEQTKAAAAANAKETARMSYEELKKSLPNVPKETLEKIRLATERYTETVNASWSVKESMAVYKEKYGADFSEEELKHILADIKSPLGQRTLAASKRAVAAWQAYIRDREKPAAEAATKEQSQAIRRAFSEAKTATE